MMPSVEVAGKIAEALEVSLDYLVGATETLHETNVVNLILDIQKLQDNDKQHVFALLDAFLKQTKLQAFGCISNIYFFYNILVILPKEKHLHHRNRSINFDPSKMEHVI